MKDMRLKLSFNLQLRLMKSIVLFRSFTFVLSVFLPAILEQGHSHRISVLSNHVQFDN